jgi:hypothetical protein
VDDGTQNGGSTGAAVVVTSMMPFKSGGMVAKRVRG